MGINRDPTRTPKYLIVRALRKLWLTSRERSTALKRDNYSCVKCHRKMSRAKGKEFKVQVHHIKGIDWDALAESLRDKLLCDAIDLETLCKEHHKEKTKKRV